MRVDLITLPSRRLALSQKTRPTFETAGSSRKAKDIAVVETSCPLSVLFLTDGGKGLMPCLAPVQVTIHVDTEVPSKLHSHRKQLKMLLN